MAYILPFGFPMIAILARAGLAFHWAVALLLAVILLVFAFDPAPITQHLIAAAAFGVFYFALWPLDKDTRSVLNDLFEARPVLTSLSVVWADITVSIGCVMTAIGAIPPPAWLVGGPVMIYPLAATLLFALAPPIMLFAVFYLVSWVARGSHG